MRLLQIGLLPDLPAHILPVERDLIGRMRQANFALRPSDEVAVAELTGVYDSLRAEAGWPGLQAAAGAQPQPAAAAQATAAAQPQPALQLLD